MPLGGPPFTDVFVVASADLEAGGDDPWARLETITARAYGRAKIQLKPQLSGLSVELSVCFDELRDGLEDRCRIPRPERRESRVR